MEADGGVDVIDLDLNEEPTEPYQEMESFYIRIEERIRRLEAVTLRARQRQELRRASVIEAVGEEGLIMNGEREQEVLDDVPLPIEELSSAPTTGLDGLKRSNSHLLALALELEVEAKEKRNSGEAFFDCNICLKKARDPILTCCGHLYCWPCFYQLPDEGADTKECPTCKGEVKDTGIIPIYGSSDKAAASVINVSGSGVMIPPRPQARRIESLRQQRIVRGIRPSRIEEVLRGLRTFSTLSSNLSSALSSAERIVEDLEGMAHMYPSTERRYQVVFDTDSNSHIVVPVPTDSSAANDGITPGLPSSSTLAAGNGTASSNNAVHSDPAASFSRRISPRRRIHSQGQFTDVTVGMQRRSSRSSRSEQREQLRTILRSRTEQAVLDLSGVEHPTQINSLDLLPVQVVSAHSSLSHNLDDTYSAMPETSTTALLSSSRRRSDTSEASGSGTPERRRRRLR